MTTQETVNYFGALPPKKKFKKDKNRAKNAGPALIYRSIATQCEKIG
jgi:hypothetical protein